uniref:N-alpha-acetyltransferase 38, NatC auxiliary subunit-like n=1 Tax=Myxine glutinosa TaxID=7769 RepID=UPI0035901BE1
MSADEGDVQCYALAGARLDNWLNRSMQIRMSDGRTLIGSFLCTDRDCNVILGSAQEFLKGTEPTTQAEARVLGLAMVPGHHIVSIHISSGDSTVSETMD